MKRTLKYIALTGAMLTTPYMGFAADYNLKFQTAFLPDSNNFKEQKAWLDTLEQATDGRLKITLVGNGQIVKYNETIDAMRLGLLDGHLNMLAFNADKEPAFMLLTNAVGAWDSGEQASRFLKADGEKLISEILADYDIHLIGTLNQGLESFLSKRATQGAADFKGMRLRVADKLSADIFKAYGAEPKFVGFGDVIPALKQDAIDGADFTYLPDNQLLGANDIAKNPIYPGFHIPITDVSISKKAWDKLPADIQQTLTSSVASYSAEIMKKQQARDEKTLQELSGNSDITVNKWSDAERKNFRTTAMEYWAKVGTQSPHAKKAYSALVNFFQNEK